MADIKIGGKLRNIQDIKGTIAEASQISFNGSDVAAELEELKKNKTSQTITEISSADIDSISEPGIYKVINAENAPTTETNGILGVINYGNNTYKQIWEKDGEYAFRYCSLESVFPDKTDVVISGGGATVDSDGNVKIKTGSNVTLSGYIHGHIEYILNDGDTDDSIASGSVLRLNGLSILSESENVIYYPFKKKKLEIKLESDSSNAVIINSATIASSSNAAIYSESSIVINGTGLLAISNSFGGHGIKADEIYFSGNPSIYIDCHGGHDGIHGSKLVRIENGYYKILNTNDAIGSGDTGDVYIFGGEFIIDGTNSGQNAVDAKHIGRIEGLNTKITLDNISSKIPFGNNVSVLDSVEIIAPEDYTVTTLTEAELYDSPSVYFGYVEEDTTGNITIIKDETVEIPLESNVYSVPEAPEKEINGVLEKASIIITGLVRGQINLATYQTPEIYLNNAYISTTVTPSILYNLKNGKLKIKTLEGTINYVCAQTPSGSGDLDAIKSENNIDFKNDGVTFIASAGEDAMDGSTVCLRGDGLVYFVNSSRGLKGSKIYIGCELNDSNLPDELSTKLHHQNLYFMNNKKDDNLNGESKQDFADLYARSGKLTKLNGFLTIHEKQYGIILTESIKARGGVSKINSSNDVYVLKEYGVKQILPNSETSPTGFEDVPVSDTVKYQLYDNVNRTTDVSNAITNATIKKLSGKWTLLRETPDVDLSGLATKTELSNAISEIKTIKKYTDFADATNDIDNLETGTVVSIINTGSKDYNEDYDLYMVVKDTTNVKAFKKIEGGSGSTDVDSISFNIESVDVELNGETKTYENFDEYIECDIGAKITFNYKFTSVNPDIRGRVYFKRGTLVLSSDYKYPTDESAEPSKFTYNTSDMTSGTYTFTAYATDSANRPTKRINIKFRIGGLSVSSDFDEDTVLNANSKVSIPIDVVSADIESEITATYTIDSQTFNQVVKIGSNDLIIPEEYITVGTHVITIILKTATRQSNILTYNVIIAEAGAVYAITDKQEYETPEGTRVQILLRTIQLNALYLNFYATLKVYSGVSKEDVLANIENDSLADKLVELNNKTESTYKLSFGSNLIQFTGLDVGSYVVFFKVTSDDTTATPAYVAFDLTITENNYNIQPIADSSLKCCFKAEGNSNNSDDRETWYDLSGNNVSATFNNFNWTTNGWLEDEDGQTALTLNSGAYVELGITPFEKEVTDGMTISIDFSTKDILDSDAKVISCLYETEGTDTTTYYLRDAFGDYIKADFNIGSNNNIVKYFKYTGGYCWIDGETYPGDGLRDDDDELPYEVTYSPSERAINYNLGSENPDYDGTNDLKKCIGQEQTSVTKQTGFYIDTQYAVLSNSASPANIDGKFYLNFSEDTRTRIDFVISRKETSGKEVYFFPSMIGYTNGCLSLMKQISDSEKFIQTSPVIGRKFKVYLGCKASYDKNGNIEISDTGSAKIYSFRIYDKALTPDQILYNYAAEIPDQEKKKKVIDSNDILEQSSIPPLPEICLIGAPIKDNSGNESYTINKFIMQLTNTEESQIKDLKKVKEPAYLTYTDYSNPSNNWKLTTKDPTNPDLTIEDTNIPIRLQFQGTSSMVYPMKNYKFKCYDGMTIDGQTATYGGKKKFNIGNGIDENTFCIKAD